MKLPRTIRRWLFGTPAVIGTNGAVKELLRKERHERARRKLAELKKSANQKRKDGSIRSPAQGERTYRYAGRYRTKEEW